LIAVLRLGHRPLRDKRITTHVALAARAFGAQGVFLATEDRKLRESVERVVESWGGEFFFRIRKDWKRFLKEWEGVTVHLTMYGLPFEENMGELRDKDLLVVLGAEKVPGEVYRLVDYNLAVGHQPHSEISALALFLDRYTNGGWVNKDFGGDLKIRPSERGKKLQRD